MLKNLSIKTQLRLIPTMIILSFIVIFASVIIGFKAIDDKVEKADEANKIIKLLYDARADEKNYIIFKNPKYIELVENKINQALNIANNLEKKFDSPENIEQIKEVKNALKEYLKYFDKYVKNRQKALNIQDDMVADAREVEEIVKKLSRIQNKKEIKSYHRQKKYQK
ncbi:CHASE3 domain-containing protein [Caminibacter sp.]